MNAGLCYCDNDVCRMKTRCKRWKEGCKRRSMRFMFMTFEPDTHRDKCKHYVSYWLS